MRVFKFRWFQRFSRKEGIPDLLLLQTVGRAESGQIDAALGGDVIKQRIARSGQGRSRGYRTIVFFRLGTAAFFVFGFVKNDLANINDYEVQQFRDAAKHVLALTDKQLGLLVKAGDFLEVKGE